jgi:hypothetical protein
MASSSSLPPSAPAKAPGPCPCLLPLSRKTAAPRQLTFSSAPARRPLTGTRAVSAQQSSAEFDEDEDQEYEDDDDDGVVDVDAMEDEARCAAADLAERLARELHVGERLLSSWTVPVPSCPMRSKLQNLCSTLVCSTGVVGRTNWARIFGSRLLSAVGCLHVGPRRRLLRAVARARPAYRLVLLRRVASFE